MALPARSDALTGAHTTDPPERHAQRTGTTPRHGTATRTSYTGPERWRAGKGASMDGEDRVTTRRASAPRILLVRLRAEAEDVGDDSRRAQASTQRGGLDARAG